MWKIEDKVLELEVESFEQRVETVETVEKVEHLEKDRASIVSIVSTFSIESTGATNLSSNAASRPYFMMTDIPGLNPSMGFTGEAFTWNVRMSYCPVVFVAFQAA